MSVIAFPNIAPQGPGARIDWELRSNTARFISPLTGSTRTLERGGAHWAATLRYENLNGAEAAQFRAFLSSFRGQAQRCYLPAFGYTQRGSFPATELLTNPYFASGTAGWSAQANSGATPVISAHDGLLRLLCTGNASQPHIYQSAVAVTQYEPYAARCIAHPGRGMTADQLFSFISDGTGSASAVTPRPAVLVSLSAGLTPIFYQSSASSIAGDFCEFSNASLARCALVDNGPNMLLRSDELDNAAWTKTQCTISTNTGTAPDGTATADAIIDDGVNAQHYVFQTVTVSSAAADYSLSVAAFPSNRSFVVLSLSDFTSDVRVWFNVTTGAIGSTVEGGGGGTFDNHRASIQSLGGGWYKCSIVSRKTSSATSIAAQIFAADADADSDYAGGTNTAIYLWRATMAQSSVPTRLVQTTSAATLGTSQTGGALHLKGLPASTNGLLLQGDLAQIITPSGSQLVRARSALNSDAAGLGYFEFEPPLRESPADNAAVIVRNPLMRSLLDERNVRWTQRHAGFVDLDLTLVEDITS